MTTSSSLAYFAARQAEPIPEEPERYVRPFKQYRMRQDLIDAYARCAELYPEHQHLKTVKDGR